MFRQSGAITAVAVTTAIIARSAGTAAAAGATASASAGAVQAHVFLVFAAILVLTVPLIRLVPEHHGSW
jgi:hypothetical protein